MAAAAAAVDIAGAVSVVAVVAFMLWFRSLPLMPVDQKQESSFEVTSNTTQNQSAQMDGAGTASFFRGYVQNLSIGVRLAGSSHVLVHGRSLFCHVIASFSRKLFYHSCSVGCVDRDGDRLRSFASPLTLVSPVQYRLDSRLLLWLNYTKWSYIQPRSLLLIYAKIS